MTHVRQYDDSCTVTVTRYDGVCPSCGAPNFAYFIRRVDEPEERVVDCLDCHEDVAVTREART